jgi:hypothetical protein
MSGETVSGRSYDHARVRGFAPWTPREGPAELIGQVQGILEVYREHLPLTARQIFYRLVGQHGFDKTEKAYARLCEHLNRARRAGMISFEAIRDDGTTSLGAGGWSSEASFYHSVRYWAQDFELSKRLGQPVHAELWVEASGMAPQAARVANRYGIDVYSAGGFNSLTDKHDTAQRLALHDRAVVLHVGDYDPSGLAIIDSLADDINEFHASLRTTSWTRAALRDEAPPLEWRRIIVTPEQIEAYSLPTAPQKATDVRGEHMDSTVQAEALDPDTLAAIIETACQAVTDQETLDHVHEQELEIRSRLIEWVDRADA